MVGLENSNFISIDAGTQGLRVGIVNSFGEVLATHEEFYNTYFLENEWAEQKSEDWWNALKSTLSRCIKDIGEEEKKKIISCCICATSSTVLPVDNYGQPLSNAILWMDSRAKRETELINSKKHEVLKYCGGEVSVEWIIPKILWIKNNKRHVYEKSYKIVEQLDWLNYKLTGKWVSSKCNATCKWNYVEELGGWNSNYFVDIGLEDYRDKLILDVKEVGENIGVISNSVKEEFGLLSNISVIQGGIDAHIVMLGLGVNKPGTMASIMGTSFVHFALSKEPIFQEGIWGPYDKAILSDYWLLECGQISAGSITKWFIDSFKISDENPYKIMIEESSKVPIGSEGVVVLDFFQGNRTPYKDPDAKGVIYGLNLVHTRGHIYRAILESVAFGTRNIIENFERQNYGIDTIVACGGVAKNELWLQIISDATGKSIVINRNTNAGILGCSIVASVGIGIHKSIEEAAEVMVQENYRINPNMENHILYEPHYKKYLDIYNSLKDIMHKK